jgi:hypothetical protein
MTEDLTKSSLDIISSMAEKFLTEGAEPQLDVIFCKSDRFKKYKGKDGFLIRAYMDMYYRRGFRIQCEVAKGDLHSLLYRRIFCFII